MASIAISSVVLPKAEQNGLTAKPAPIPTEMQVQTPAPLNPDTIILSANASIGPSVPAVEGYPGITVARQIAATLITAATVPTHTGTPSAPPEMTGKR